MTEAVAVAQQLYPNPHISGFNPDTGGGAWAPTIRHRRYLSAETAASLTGRVLGVYARDGEVAVAAVHYLGTEPEGAE